MSTQLDNQIRDAKLGWVYWATYAVARAKGKSVVQANEIAVKAMSDVKA